jgi:hypothetical protein
MAALWELVDDKCNALDEINSIGLPDTNISFSKVTTCGISCTKANIVVNGVQEGGSDKYKSHRTYSDVTKIIDDLNVSDNVKKKAKAVYQAIANAESKIHNTDVSMIHFHELGMLDAIADITVCCYLFDLLNIEHVVFSPINVGKGNVNTAHGIIPVPAPATSEILLGVPIYSNDITSELCTPTGAALAKSFANEFSAMPLMNIDKVGYGAGSKVFAQANCVRTFLGNTADICDQVIELCCNIDDMTGEDISFACEMIFEAGAIEVYTQPAYMKKSRLGTLITVLCKTENREEVIKSIFKHTSTIGIRERICNRYVLERESSVLRTPLGDLRSKSSTGYGVNKCKYEYDDLSRIARDNNLSLEQVKKNLNIK